MIFKRLFPLLALFFLFSCVSGEQIQYNVKLSPDAKQAGLMEAEGNYRQALELYNIALEEYRTKDKKLGILFCLERMGWLNREIGNYALALKQFQEAYPLAESLNGDAAEIDADFGDIYLFTGDNRRAAEYYEKTLSKLRDFEFPIEYAGPPSTAILSEITRKSKAIIHARSVYGILFLFDKKYEKAIEQANKSDELIQRIIQVANDPLYGMFYQPTRDVYEGMGFTYTVKGTALAALKRYDEAWKFFDKGISAFQLGEKDFGIIVNKSFRFREEFRMGMKITEETIQAYDALLEQAESFGAIEVVWRMSFEIGRELKKRNENEAALRYLTKAVDTLEETRTRLREDTMKQMFATNSQDVYRELIGLLHDMGRDEEGFEYLERSKARAFLDVLGGRSVKAKAVVPPELVEKDRTLNQQIDETITLLKASDKKKRGALRQHYKELIQERRTNIEAIKKQSLEYAATTTVAVQSAQDIANKLQKDEALISYFFDNDRTIIWVIQKEKINAITVQISEQAIEAITSNFRDGITSGQKKLYQKASLDLAKNLYQPIAHLLGKTKQLYIVPSKSLNYLPFSALPIGKGEYLVHKFSITVLPNATSLDYLDKAVTKNRDSIFAIGNPFRTTGEVPLKYAEEEVKIIAANFPKKTVLSGKLGSETAMKQRDFSETGFLHIAAHGKYNPRHPLQSSLLLSQDEENDGNLETFEIFGLNIKAQLAVLSACESGVGKLGNGDEVQSLNRAFLYAGAGGVVATLWKVSDKSTFEFMDSFYQELKRNAPAAALRNAQRKLLKKYPSPYYWAPFYLTGGTNNSHE